MRGSAFSDSAVSTSFLAKENFSRLLLALVRFLTASSAASRCLRKRSANASSWAVRDGAGAGDGVGAAGRGAIAAVPGRGAMGAGRATTFAVTCCPPEG
jgi:hypothetical protein